MSWEEHPEKYPCPRCGSAAGDAWCLPLRDGTGHYSILTMHTIRGATPYDLQRWGYVSYTAVVDGQTMTLWRKPGTPRCTRGSTIPPEPAEPT
ncbi:hypothetical protein ACI2IX_20015 [Leifsonia aquatica]|uniref:hypothetical protein n=1 Tax=Leifsonia aquatica TaxID=144185 RepID=UPI00384AACD4